MNKKNIKYDVSEEEDNSVKLRHEDNVESVSGGQTIHDVLISVRRLECRPYTVMT